MRRRLAGLLLCALAAAVPGEEYKFDLSGYEKKPFEVNGYLEAKPEYRRFNRESALYQLDFPAAGDRPGSDERFSAALELAGLYRFGPSSLNFRLHGATRHDLSGSESNLALYELYYRNSSDKLTFELGKRALKWGTGYAWNPVGFIQRRKDPTDPELSREGYVIASLDTVRSFDGPLQTLAFTSVLLPVTGDINGDFSPQEDINLAGRLYLLYRDTDIDFLFLTNGSRSGRVGIDFSRNLATNWEIHGELAWIHDQSRTVPDENGALAIHTADTLSYLLGLRYLSARDTTYILEYYHNGSGLSESEARRFFDLVDSAEASGDNALLARARNIADQAGFVTPNYMRDYLHLRLIQKEPFGVVYLTADLTSIVNLQDGSYSFIPGLTYSGSR